MLCLGFKFVCVVDHVMSRDMLGGGGELGQLGGPSRSELTRVGREGLIIDLLMKFWVRRVGKNKKSSGSLNRMKIRADRWQHAREEWACAASSARAKTLLCATVRASLRLRPAILSVSSGKGRPGCLHANVRRRTT